MSTEASLPAVKVVYTLSEAAALLGVSRPTINRFIRRGELRVSRLGHKTARVTLEAIMDLLRAHEETGAVRARSTGQKIVPSAGDLRGTRKRFAPLTKAPGEAKQIRKAPAGRRN